MKEKYQTDKTVVCSCEVGYPENSVFSIIRKQNAAFIVIMEHNDMICYYHNVIYDIYNIMICDIICILQSFILDFSVLDVPDLLQHRHCVLSGMA